MSAIKLHVIKPSVNNMTARVFVRAAKLDFTEDDAYGKTRSEEYSAKNPSHLTPMIEAPHLPNGVMWESCAIMQYLCNKHHLDAFYPTEPEKRAMVDSAMFYIVGTLYPYIARATYPALGFPQYAGEVARATPTPIRRRRRRRPPRRPSARRSKCSGNSISRAGPSSAATTSPSPTSASRAASSSSTRSTTRSTNGRGATPPPSRRRSATPTPSRRETSRGTSST